MTLTKLILGTVQLGIDYGINNSTGKPSLPEALAILKEAQLLGITTLDTAKAYGNAMQVIGEFHKNNPPFQLISKFHTYQEKFTAKEFQEDINELGVNTLEALLFHSFSDYKKNKEGITVLQELKANHKLNKIGVSVYTNNELEEVLNDATIDLIQLPFNVLDNDNCRGKLLHQAKQKGKEIHVRSLFLQGLFFKNLEELPTKLIQLKPYLQKLHQLANELNLTVSQLAFMYVLQQKNIDKILFGVEHLSQLRNNVKLIKELPSFDVTEHVNLTINVKEITLLNPVNWK